MSGSIGKILIIALAVGTYASLAFMIMRFALTDPEVDHPDNEEGPQADGRSRSHPPSLLASRTPIPRP